MFLGATLVAPGHGGIAVVARLTARALLDMGEQVEMLSLLDERPVVLPGITCPTTRSNRLAYVARCYVAAMRHHLCIYDHVGMARAHPRLGRFTPPYVVWMHGIEVWYHLTPEKARILKNAELVLVNSHFTLKRFQELHFELHNAQVCHLATEQDEAPQQFPDFSGPPTVLVLARQDKGAYHKGHRELIECWPKVVQAVPDARLMIVGGGDGLPLTKELVASSPVSKHIKVLGFVPDEQLPGLWQQAHVFAMPSRKEGFGLVYVEAMRHKLPVIASVHDAGQEVNQDGVTGFNVNLDHPEELVARITSLLSVQAKARDMGLAGFQYWQQHYRYRVFLHRLQQCLNTLFHL